MPRHCCEQVLKFRLRSNHWLLCLLYIDRFPWPQATLRTLLQIHWMANSLDLRSYRAGILNRKLKNAFFFSRRKKMIFHRKNLPIFNRSTVCVLRICMAINLSLVHFCTLRFIRILSIFVHDYRFTHHLQW